MFHRDVKTLIRTHEISWKENLCKFSGNLCFSLGSFIVDFLAFISVLTCHQLCPTVANVWLLSLEVVLFCTAGENASSRLFLGTCKFKTWLKMYSTSDKQILYSVLLYRFEKQFFCYSDNMRRYETQVTLSYVCWYRAVQYITLGM